MTSYDDLKPVVKRASKSVAYQWPGVVDKDDLEQSIWIRLLESPGTVNKCLEMDERARYRAIIGIGHQLAAQERADYDYYKGSYRYSVKEVRELLGQSILTEPLPNFSAELLDLIDGMAAIAEQYAVAIESRYTDLVVPTAGADKQRLSDGLSSLADEMNKAQKRRYSERDDGVGTRKPVGREAARYASKNGYDNDSPVLPSHMRDDSLQREVWE